MGTGVVYEILREPGAIFLKFGGRELCRGRRQRHYVRVQTVRINGNDNVRLTSVPYERARRKDFTRGFGPPRGGLLSSK